MFHPATKASMSKHKKDMIVSKMGREMKMNPPSILKKVAKKQGKKKAEKVRRAILLSKARQAGAKIPGGKK